MNAASADQIRALAQRAKVCGLDEDPTIPIDLRQVIATANRDQRLLTAEELQRCCQWSGLTTLRWSAFKTSSLSS